MARRILILVAFALFDAQPGWAADAARGKELFERLCTHCHTTTHEEKFGPGLADVTKRVPPEKLDRWLADPVGMAQTDEYFRKLRASNRWGMQMPPYPEMKDPKARADVIEYLKTLHSEE